MFSTIQSGLRTAGRAIGLATAKIEPYNGHGGWLRNANARLDELMRKYSDKPRFVNCVKIIKTVSPLLAVISKFKNHIIYATTFFGLDELASAMIDARSDASGDNMLEIVSEYMHGVAEYFNDFKVNSTDTIKRAFRRAHPVTNVRLEGRDVYDSMLLMLIGPRGNITSLLSKLDRTDVIDASLAAYQPEMGGPFAGLVNEIQRVENEAYSATMLNALSSRSLGGSTTREANALRSRLQRNFNRNLPMFRNEPAGPEGMSASAAAASRANAAGAPAAGTKKHPIFHLGNLMNGKFNNNNTNSNNNSNANITIESLRRRKPQQAYAAAAAAMPAATGAGGQAAPASSRIPSIFSLFGTSAPRAVSSRPGAEETVRVFEHVPSTISKSFENSTGPNTEFYGRGGKRSTRRLRKASKKTRKSRK